MLKCHALIENLKELPEMYSSMRSSEMALGFNQVKVDFVWL